MNVADTIAAKMVLHSIQLGGLLICTLISENQGLEKSRSVSNIRKISGPAHLDFFSVCRLDFFQVYGINLAFFSRWRLDLVETLEKNPALQDLNLSNVCNRP